MRFDDGTIFFETLQRFGTKFNQPHSSSVNSLQIEGPAVYEKKKHMEVLLFLRKKSGVTTSNLQSFVLQVSAFHHNLD